MSAKKNLKENLRLVAILCGDGWEVAFRGHPNWVECHIREDWFTLAHHRQKKRPKGWMAMAQGSTPEVALNKTIEQLRWLIKEDPERFDDIGDNILEALGD
jgi:hypothetical protein